MLTRSCGVGAPGDSTLPIRRWGILGGSGHLAGAALTASVARICARRANRRHPDASQVDVVTYNVAVDGIDATGVACPATVTAELERGVAILVGAGCDGIVTACNSNADLAGTVLEAHGGPNIRYLDLTGETIGAARRSSDNMTLAVGASMSSRTSGRYLHTLGTTGTHRWLDPNATDELIVDGALGTCDPHRWWNLLTETRETGVGAVVAGCTELHLHHQAGLDRGWRPPLPVIDSVTVAAHTMVDWSTR